MPGTMRRLLVAILAVITAWFLEVMAMLLSLALFDVKPSDLVDPVAAPGTALSGLLNAALLLTPLVVVSRVIYRRWTRPRPRSMR